MNLADLVVWHTPPPQPSPARGEGAQPSCSPHTKWRNQRSQLALHVAAETIDHALSRQSDELHVAGLARLETHRGPGGDVEAHAAGPFAVELQGGVGFEEMVVRADLDRTVAGIGDGERHLLAAGIEFDLAVLDEEFAGDHVALLSDRLMHGDEFCAVRERR